MGIFFPAISREERNSQVRNIVLISLDTVRADHLGFLGYPKASSPFLDGYSQNCAVFTHAYSNGSTTMLSHMNLLTGYFPEQHGVIFPAQLGKTPAERYRDYNPSIKLLPEYLRETGMRTARFADARDSFLDIARGFGRGLDEIYPFGLSGPEHLAKIRSWIRGKKDAPFFLFLHSKLSHAPYRIESPYDELFLKPGYSGPLAETAQEQARLRESALRKMRASLGISRATLDKITRFNFEQYTMKLLAGPLSAADKERHIAVYDTAIRMNDDLVKGIIEGLRNEALLNDTLVIIAADHGESLFERGETGHISLHEEVLHVPLLFCLPGERGRRIDAEVQLTDIVPTILELKGVGDAGFKGMGKSLLPLLQGKTAKLHDFLVFFGLGRGGVPEQAISKDAWKAVFGVAKEELYFHGNDPSELNDLSAREKERLSELHVLLKDHESRAREHLSKP